MSLNLCRTFLSLKTSFLIIFCKKKLEYDGGGAHVRNCARATSSILFSTCNILPLKKTLITHFPVLFVKNYFFCYFSHVPWDNQSHLQKKSGPKVLSFSWNLALRGYNNAHYEIIGVDIWQLFLNYCVCMSIKFNKPKACELEAIEKNEELYTTRRPE